MDTSSTKSLQSDNEINVAGGTVYADMALRERADRAIWLSLKAFGEYWRLQRTFSRLAPFLGISSRRLRAFRFREEALLKPLTDQQAEAVIAGHVTALRSLAQHLREQAATWDEIASREEASYRCPITAGESCHQPAKKQSASA